MGYISALSAEPELVCRLTIPNAGWVNALCGLPNGVLAAGAHGLKFGGTATLYDINSGACLLKLGHAQPVKALASLPDGKLASGTADGKVCVWSIETGQCLLTLAGHTRVVRGLVWLPDGQLASSSWDSTVRVWNLQSGTQSVVMHTPPKSACTGSAARRQISVEFGGPNSARVGLYQRCMFVFHTSWLYHQGYHCDARR